MKLRWSFRAANDRGPQAESRIPGESPTNAETLEFQRLLFLFLHITRLLIFNVIYTNQGALKNGNN